MTPALAFAMLDSLAGRL